MGRGLLGRGRIFFVDGRDSRFVELKHGAFRHFDDHRLVFHVVNNAVDARAGDHFIARLQRGDACGHFFALALLRADHQEVKHHHHEAHHDEGAA